MLKRVNRISKTRELQKVYRSQRSQHTPALVIKFVAGVRTRTVFVVSKKVSKKAVERNRIKRVLREQVRKDLDRLIPGDYMFIVKAQASVMKNPELRDQLKNGLSKAKLWQI